MIAFMMSELHQQYSEIMNMDSMDVRGILQIYSDRKSQTTTSNNDNTGEISDEDYDTSEWFK